MTQPIETEVPGLYVLPLPTPFPIGRINTYLACGDPLTLIDTGVNSARSYDELVEGLAALGFTPADLKRIIITHHHTDHIGLVDRLVETSGAEVWCHARCLPYIETPVEARNRLGQWSVNVWREGGAPQSLLDMTEQLFAWFASLSNGPAQVARTLEDGDHIDMLGHAWTVLYTPGHAGDLICLYEPQSAILISSDHLLRDVSSNALTEPPEPGQKRPYRLLEYMAQLRRIAELAPRIAYGGHGKPATAIPDLIASRLAFHRDRAEQIMTLLGGETHTLYSITEMMFGHVSEAEKFLALSEVLGHLDWLERDKRITRVPGGTVTRWQAV